MDRESARPFDKPSFAVVNIDYREPSGPGSDIAVYLDARLTALLEIDRLLYRPAADGPRPA